MFDALIAKNKRRAVQPNGFAHLCYQGKMTPRGFQGVCVGLLPDFDEACRFLDGKRVKMAYMAYEPWFDWQEHDEDVQ